MKALFYFNEQQPLGTDWKITLQLLNDKNSGLKALTILRKDTTELSKSNKKLHSVTRAQFDDDHLRITAKLPKPVSA